MQYCLICNVEFDSTRSFKLHLKRQHSLTLKEYVIKTQHVGVHPVCACGCGQKVSWRQDNHFQKLIHGHVTDEFRQLQRKNRLGKKISQETKERLSQSLQTFWSSDVGQDVAIKKSIKMREFHASDEGKKWSSDQSLRLSTFNSTEKGKAIRRSVGQKIKAYRDANPAVVLAMGQKLKKHWASEEGKRFLAQRSEKIKAYYASDEGKVTLDSMKKKLRASKRFTHEEFTKRLHETFQELEPLSDVPTYESYVNYRSFDIDFTIRCKAENHIQTRKLINIINIPYCLICKGTFSKPQHDIAQFIEGLGHRVVENCRDVIHPLELDVFVPERNFAIEFNGLYWHSEVNRRDNYVVELKHGLTHEKGVKLLTIFEDEWRDKRKLIESMIRHRLGQSRRVFARKLTMMPINHKQRSEFMNESHLEGDVKSMVSWGLFDGDELVSALSVRRPFHRSLLIHAEVGRFATKSDVCVVGGLSRLSHCALTWAKNNGYSGLMAYVDRRVGLGDGYLAAGYRHVRTTGPRFWWTDFRQRFNRFKFKASGGLDQASIATHAGVHKIWGAGNQVFLFE